MDLFLFISCISFWPCILIDARPEDLFSFDSSNEPTGPVFNDVDITSLQSLNDPSSNEISPTDLVFTSATSTNEYDADPYHLEVSDLFSEEDHPINTNPFFQGASACETDGRLSWVDDGAPNLQARDDASCRPSKPKENIDSIMNIFQDPESFLRQNIPPNKGSAGQTHQPGQDDENFSLDTLLNNRPAPLLFEEDGNKCPIAEFGLSTTPVCLDSLTGSAIGSPGSGFTLHDVEPCKSRLQNTVLAGSCAWQGFNAAIDISNAPSCPEDKELWCCREITSEVKFAVFQDDIENDKVLILYRSALANQRPRPVTQP